MFPRSALPSLPSSPGAPVAFAGGTTTTGWGSTSPWFAVQGGSGRQQLRLLPQDTARSLDPWSRVEIMLIARTLYANYGCARGVNTLAKIIGSLRPQSRTGDPAFDTAAESYFAGIAESPDLFDASGRHNFYSYQVATTLRRLIDGDLFSVLTHSPFGNGMIASREAHLVKGGDTTERWFDGIRTDRNGRAESYRFVDPRDSDDIRILPAAAVHHHVDRDTLGGARSQSAFAHAANHFRDIIETRGFMKQAIKQASLIAVTRRQDAAHNTPISSMGAGAPTYMSPLVQPGSSFPATAQEAAEAPRGRFEDFVAAGIFSQVPLDVLHDDRPHPNQMEFARDLLREVANGIGVPHQILYFMDDPGGAWSRILLEILAKFVLDQHLHHLRPFCQRYWNFVIATGISTGALPPCSTGDWWRVRWTPPRSITADLGRTGRLVIELRKALLTTYAAHYEEMGLDYEDELRQGAAELKLLKDLEKEYGLDPGDLTSALRPSNAPAAAPAPKADEEDEDEDEQDQEDEADLADDEEESDADDDEKTARKKS